MGAIVSKWRRDDDGDFEKILSALDDKIRQAEIRLSESKLRERRVVILWLVYSLFFYILYVVAYVTYLRFHLTGQNWLPLTSALAVAPVGIYAIRNLIYLYYERRKSSEEANLEALLAKQKHKVEELKQKNAYYSTKSLLERYESPSRTPNSLGAGKAIPPGTPSTPTRQPPHSTPAMTTPANAKTSGASPAMSDARQRPLPKTVVRSMINSAQPQTPSFTPQQRTPQNMSMPTPYARQTPQPRAWYDKLVDVVIGEEGPETKYAIICEQCFAHNGLVIAEELEDIQYICPKCSHFNQSRRKRREGTTGGPSGIDGDVIKPTVLKNGGLSSMQQRPSVSNKPKEKEMKELSLENPKKPMLLRTSSRTSAAPQSPIVSSTPRHSSRLRNPISPNSSPSPSPSPTPLTYPTADARPASSEGESEEDESENEAEISTPIVDDGVVDGEVVEEVEEEEERGVDSEVTETEEVEESVPSSSGSNSAKKAVRKKKKGRRG